MAMRKFGELLDFIKYFVAVFVIFVILFVAFDVLFHVCIEINRNQYKRIQGHKKLHNNVKDVDFDPLRHNELTFLTESSFILKSSNACIYSEDISIYNIQNPVLNCIGKISIYSHKLIIEKLIGITTENATNAAETQKYTIKYNPPKHVTIVYK